MTCSMRLSLSIITMFLCLFAFAASAQAECAWVLWFTSGYPGSPITSPLSAYPTRDECLREAAGKATSLEEYKRKNPNDVAYVKCLPDTVDPREPKGK